MSNFSFLKDTPEYKDFAAECIDAEEAFQNSPDACIKLVRNALESSVKWLYRRDKKFVKVNHPQSNEKESLLALTTAPNFINAVGKNLTDKIHFCRKAGNRAIHDEKTFSNEDALKCLQFLFEFVQWIDKNYGKNYRPRSFDPEEVPVKDSDLKSFLKAAALVGAGFLGKIIFDAFTKDDV